MPKKTINYKSIRLILEIMQLTKHNQVDDYPYGGGQGMVLKPEPVLMRWKT